jgi:ABC-2 type transport system ATP-binding protein
MTARENLTYVARLNNLPEEQIKERVIETLSLVGLASEADKTAGAYSRGMRQRLGIAEVLIKKPGLVFLDEPTLGLDPDGINRMLDLIVDLSQEQKMTVLLSSHHLYQVQRICTEVGIMSRGRIIAQGGIKELAEQLPGPKGKPGSTLEEIYMRYFKEA